MKITIITGRVHKDPEMRYTPTGIPVCNFTVAVSNGKDESGEWRKSDWYRVTAWQKKAEIAMKFIKAGSKVLVVGFMKAPKPYTDKNGEARASLDLIATEVEFLSGPNDENHNEEPMHDDTNEGEEIPF